MNVNATEIETDMEGVSSDDPTIEKIPVDELNWSGEYQVMPSLADDEYSSLREKIEAEGFDEAHPIIVDEDNTVIDGHHRCQICDELGITDVYAYQKDGLSNEEKIKSSFAENTARRNLGRGEKREAVKNFYVDHYNGESLRDIASLIGVSRGTVSNAKDELSETEWGFLKPAVSTLDTSDTQHDSDVEAPSNLDTPDVQQEHDTDDTTEVQQEPSTLDTSDVGGTEEKSSLESFTQHLESAKSVVPELDSDGRDAALGAVEDLRDTITK